MQKFKPGNMIMSEAVQFGQKWTYYNDHDMEEMTEPEYFKSHQGIKVGDEIRINKVTYIKNENVSVLSAAKVETVDCIAEVLVAAIKPLKFFVLRKATRTIIGRPKKEEAA